MYIITLLADAAPQSSAFTSIDYVLGGVIVTLGGIIAKGYLEIRSLRDKIEEVQEDRRKTEVEAYKALLPLTTRVVDVIDELHPLIKLLPIEGKK